MENKPLTVHCSYDEQGPELCDLIVKSFEQFAQTELHIFAKPVKDVLS